MLRGVLNANGLSYHCVNTAHSALIAKLLVRIPAHKQRCDDAAQHGAAKKCDRRRASCLGWS